VLARAAAPDALEGGSACTGQAARPVELPDFYVAFIINPRSGEEYLVPRISAVIIATRTIQAQRGVPEVTATDHPNAMPDNQLTDQQRAVLTFLRSKNAYLLDAFTKTLASLGVKDAGGDGLTITSFSVADSKTLPPEGLCCICCPDGTFCCHGSTCSGCCATHS
jgi:hypothetical protein